MPFQVLNPMEAMQVGADRARANRLADIQEADIVRGQREREMLNQLYQQAYNQQTGNVDFNRLYGGLAAQGMGTVIPGIQKSQADIAKTQAEALRQTAESGKISGETIANRMKYWRDSIPTDPSMAPNWVAGVYSDPIVAPILRQIGTQDQVIKTIPKDPAQYQQWAQNWSMGAQKFNEAMMPYVTPKSPAVMKQELEKAAAGKTILSVGVNTEKKFGEVLAGKAGERLDTYRENAEQAVRAMQTNARLKPLINDPSFISGTFADARTAVARALGMDVSATESFFSGMAEQVAARIKAFGAGTGLSDSDRQYALAWAGGKPDLSAKGIARIMRINDESSKTSIDKYNKERQFLGKKNPMLFDFYPEVVAEPANNEMRTVVRTGTDTVTGKKVVQYSDGTTEYAP